jgi:hypothetical protein
MPAAEDISIVAALVSENAAPKLVPLSGNRAPSRVLVDESEFLEVATSDWLGFYDWLRSPDGRIIGVRQYFDEPGVFPWERVFLGVEGTGVPKNELLVYFGSERNFEPARSCDQSFGNNRLLMAGERALITFRGPSGAP